MCKACFANPPGEGKEEKKPAEDTEDIDLEEEKEIDRFKLVDRVELTLTEAQIKRQLGSDPEEEADATETVEEATVEEAAPATEEKADEAKPEAAAEKDAEADKKADDDTEAKPEATADEAAEEEKKPAFV